MLTRWKRNKETAEDHIFLFKLLWAYCDGELVEKNQWISVKDRLPEESGEYLVYCPSVNRKVTSIDYYNGWFVRGIGEVKNPDKITHWQPLPTQPTEPSNETK